MREQLSWLLGAVHLPLHLHLHVRGPKLDYAGVAAGAFLSWAGLPGPGEAALVAAAIAAAHNHLDLSTLIVIGWLGATAGGMAGWLFGLRAGRSAVTARGPLRRQRLAVVETGERFFARYGVVAVLALPSWVAGIHRVRWTRYVPLNAGSALVWALGIGIGAYLIGPAIAEVAADIGSASWAVLVALVAAGVVAAVVRRRRRRGSA